MQNRWTVLAVLFLVRVSMGVQFQAVAALSPLVMESFAVGLADIGLLIGLYLAPGVAIALPGGALGARFGDRRVVALGLALMIAGGAVMMLTTDWHLQLFGRLVAGIGGVLLNVLMSKMVTDWFAGREIGTAMGIFVNSWPVGIALALMVLPVVADTAGLQAALATVTGLALCGLVLLLATYRDAPSVQAGSATGTRLTGVALAGAVTAGAIWGLYNAALGMIFGFAPAMLAERGWSLSAASSTTSIVLWLVAASLPVGGIVADRTGRRDLVLTFGLISFAVILAIAPHTDEVFIVFAALGLAGGIAAGPIMSLPSAVLSTGTRAKGMGVFFTLFYIGVVSAPLLGGWLAEVFGTARVTFLFGTALLGVACLALVYFRHLEQRVRG